MTTALRNLNQSFSGRRILGIPQVGEPASAIPSSGDQGASLLFNKIQAGDPAECLYRLWMTSQPASGTLITYEDGSFTFTGAADGTWTAGERIDKYDPAVGLSSTDTGTAQFNVNVPGAALVGAATAQATASATLSGSPAALTGAALAQTTGTGALTTSIVLSGVAAAVATGQAAISSLGAALQGAAFAVASASGVIVGPSAALVGQAVAQAIASAALTTKITLSGDAGAQTVAAGVLITSIQLEGSAISTSYGAANLTDIYTEIVIDPERILVIPSPNQTSAPAIISDFVLRGGQWTIDKDPRSELFFGVDVRFDLSLAQTTVLRVDAIPVGVTLATPGFINDPAGVVGVKVAGLDMSSDEAVNCVTFMIMCANTEVIPHTIYFRHRDK